MFVCLASSWRPSFHRLAQKKGKRLLVLLALWIGMGVGSPIAGHAQSTSSKALVLDGQDDAVVVEEEAPFDFGEGFTIAFWMKVEGNFDTAAAPLVTKGDHWQIRRRGTSDQIAFVTGHGSAASRDTLRGSTIMDDGGWHHVAVVFDDVEDEKTIYVDGVREDAVSVDAPPQPSDDSVRVGTNQNRTAYFAGQVDDLRFWSEPRTQAEIQHALWHPLSGSESGLLAYYPADEIGNQLGVPTLPDRGPNAIQGRVEGDAVLTSTDTPRSLDSMRASDALYEDRVELTWPNPANFAPESALLRVVRDDTTLTYLSTDDSTYTDATAESDVTYTYRLKVETTNGTYTYHRDEGSRSFNEAASVSATYEQYTDRIEITWEDRSKVEAGYHVYRNDSLVADLNVNSRGYVDKDSTLAPRTDYEYCVAPYDANGEGELTCDVGRLAEVIPVASFSATTGHYDNQVVLDWTDEGSGTTGFRITRDGNQIATVTDPSTTTYADTSATPGTTYTYCVIRQEGSVESTPTCSDGSAGTLAAPEAVGATDEEFDDRVELEWEDEAEIEDNYVVYRQKGDSTSSPDSTAMKQIATLDTDITSYTDTKAETGQTYTYCVVATTEEGARTQLAGTDPVDRSVDACDLGTRSVILAPEEVTAADSTAEDRVKITWSDPATRSALYRIYRKEVGESTFTPIATPANTKTQYVDEGAEPNTRHRYCVVGITRQGTESDRSCDFGSREVLKPTGVTATDDEFEDRVRVEWSDESSVEVGYRIYRRPLDENGNPTTTDSTLLHSTVRNEVVLIDTTGTPGQDYRYSVETRVQFQGDTLSTSAGSDTGRRTLENPNRVDATDGQSEKAVTVTWRDNSQAEEGYRIWRVGPSGDTTRAGQTDPNVTTFKDADASLGMRYTYLVAAFDPYGISEIDDDQGFTKILLPGSVSASDSYSNKVSVSWVDRSEREAGYKILRDGQVVTRTDSNVTTYVDRNPRASARYCVKAVTKEAGVSERVCDRGQIQTEIDETEGRKVVLEEVAAEGDKKGAGLGQNVAASVRSGTPTVIASQALQKSTKILTREDQEWGTVDSTIKGRARVDISQEAAVTVDLSAKDSSIVRQYTSAARGWDVDVKKVVASDTSGREFVGDVAIDSTLAVFALNDFTTTDSSSKAGKDSVYAGTDIVVRLDGQGDATTVASDPNFFDTNFGSVAIAGRKVAFWETQNEAVTVYKKNGSWGQLGRLKASSVPELRSEGSFGRSLALTEDRLFVGTGTKVYVYQIKDGQIRNSNKSQIQILEGFTTVRSIAVGTEGTLLVDDPFSDRAHLFQLNENGAYKREFVFTTSPDPSKRVSAVASVGIAGGQVLVGAPSKRSVRGVVYHFKGVAPPQDVTASDGSQNDRVDLAWKDKAEEEEGFRVYRNGTEITTLGPDATSYKDDDADPGKVNTYCVSAFDSDFEFETQLVCDKGWRAPDGSISGTVQKRGGSGFQGVDVCLMPNPNNSLLFDGEKGYTITNDLASDVPNEFTLEAWVRPEASTGTPTGTATAWSFNAADSGTENRLVYDYEETRFRYVNTADRVASADTFGVNTWHHVAIVVDTLGGGTKKGTLYIDGERETTFLPGQPPSKSDLFALGQDRDASGNLSDFWRGQIDDVRLWSAARSASQIDSLKNRSMTGTEDNLLAYWPLDERGGQAAANIVSEEGTYYAVYRNGVSPAQQGAPIEACVRTDADGNYTHSRLRYGDGTEFTVDPELEPYTFNPSRSAVRINEGTPVQNQVTFTDETQIPVSGTIKYANTECPVQGVEMKVDDETKGSTDSGGTYKVNVLPGERTITPVLEGGNVGTPHTFAPEDTTVEVNEETTGVDFTDTTTNTLTLKARGGCGFSIGIAKVKIRATNGCLTKTVETDSTGMLKQELPPQEYTVQVTGVRNVPDPTQKPKIERFFKRQGAYTVDLSESADTTLELRYRAPIEARVKGWPKAASCNNVDVPVLKKNKELDLDLKVVEDYGNKNLCPAGSVNVTVYDELPDKGDQPVTLTTDSNGIADYHTFARTPNLIEGRVVNGVDRSFQKSLTMIAEAGTRSDETTRWAIVEGTKPRKGTRFVTDPVDFPITVLRDPPGDGSFSYLEKGTELCNTATFGRGLEQTASVSATIGADNEFEAGWWGYYQDTKFVAEVTAGISVTASVEEGRSLTTCATTNERISTGGDGTAVGRPADVFLGAGINFVFSTSDVLQVEGEEETTCNIKRSQTTSFEPDSISTTYAYTRGHITGTMIPTLRELRRTSDEDRIDYDASIRLWEHILYQSDSLASEAEPITNDNRENISLNENVSFSGGADYEYSESRSHTSTKSVSTYISISRFLEASIGFEEPIIAKINASREVTNTISSGSETEQGDDTLWGFVLSEGEGGDNYTVNVKRDPVYGTPVFDTRSGTSSCPYEPWREPFPDFTSFKQDRKNWRNYKGELLTTRRDKARLGINGTPVKKGVPHDEKARFGARLINDSPTDEKRKYELRMLNESNPKGAIVRVNGVSLSSGRPFWVKPKTASNLTLTVERGTQAFDYDSLGVMVYAPCGFFAQARSPTLDTMYVSVQFQPPSSPIDLRAPNDGFALNRVTQEDSIDVRLQNFSMDTTDTGHRVSEIGVFYRPVTDLSQGLTAGKAASDSTAADTLEHGRYFSGEAARGLFARLKDSAKPKVERGIGALEDWSKIFERAQRDEVLAQNGCEQEQGCEYEDIRDYFERTRFRAEDGVYELAAYTKTINRKGTITGAYVSDPIRMKVDTQRPRAHGTPEPADGLLTKGDDVAITFSEDVDCATLRPNENVTLAYADSAKIPIAPTCDGRVVQLQPKTEGALEKAEDETLVATIHTDTTAEGAVQRDDEGPVSLTDRAGNPLPRDVSWRFAVQRSGLVWEPSTDTITVTEGSTAELQADLINYRTQPLRYSLEASSGALSVEGPAENPDPLSAGAVRTVQMTTEADRKPGTYTDTLRAVGADGDPTLFRLRQVVEANQKAARTPANVTASAMKAQAVEVNWAAPDSAVEQYELYRGELSAPDTTGPPLASVEAGRTQYVDSTATVGQTYYYWLVGQDADGLRSYPSAVSEAFLYPLRVNVKANRTFADGADPQDYRLVALPGNVDRALNATVSGKPGKEWSAYWDDGSTNDPFVSAQKAKTFALKPGRGYWLRYEKSWTLEDRVSTVPLQGDTVAVLDLHDGWNIISNPLEKTVDWGAVEAANDADLQTLWRFSGRYEPMDVFPSARTGEAFYFLNDTGLDSLTVPYPGAPFHRSDSARTAAKKTATAADSAIVLSTYQGGVHTSRTSVGVDAAGDKGLDSGDQFAPPSRFEGAHLRMPAPGDTLGARKQMLAQETRPSGTRGQTVNLVLEAKPGTPVRIDARRIDALGATAVRLVNRGTGRMYDLRRRQSIEVTPKAKQTNFVLLFGTTAYVKEAWSDIVPPEATLRPNYPNPFRTQTTIEYAVPEAKSVRLEVYDVLGRRIATLVDAKKDAGWHRVRWGAGTQGGRVASGVYFGRLQVGDEVYTQKMVVVR